MKRTKIVTAIPLLLSLIINPCIILQIYLVTFTISIPENVEIHTPQNIPTHHIESGETIHLKLVIEALTAITIEFEKTSENILIKLDNSLITSETVSLDPGVNEFQIQTTTPTIDWPQEHLILSYNQKYSQNKTPIQVIIYPRNWQIISGLIRLTGLFPLTIGILSLFNTKHLLSKHPVNKELEEARQTNKSLQQRVEHCASKIMLLLDWVEDLIAEEPGLYEKALRKLPNQNNHSQQQIKPIVIENPDPNKSQGQRILVKFMDSLFTDVEGGET